MVKWVVVMVAAAAAAGAQPEAVDPCFADLPPGWRVTRSWVVDPDETRAIGMRLGGRLAQLSNTFLDIHGTQLRVNLLHCVGDAAAARIHRRLLQLKGNPRFCPRVGRRVIEFTGRQASEALAVVAAHQLGFVPRPTRMRYRVRAQIATLAEADYTAFNRLCNLFFQADRDPNDAAVVRQILELSAGFEPGDSVTVLAAAGRLQGTRYGFTPEPVGHRDAAAGEIRTYSFRGMPREHGMPYVTMTAHVVATAEAMTPSARQPEETLLASTDYWPADDPEIRALAARITQGCTTTREKTEALLYWLTPNRNIRSAGPSGSRWGVKRVLRQRYGHCWDSSDCFVTLARAVGVPCRQVAGWLYGISGHVWAEVLLPEEGWWQVDPTGGRIVQCGIYHIPYAVTEDGHMPIVYVTEPTFEIIE